MAKKTPERRPRRAADDPAEALWQTLLAEAEALSLSFTDESARRLRALLRAGVERTGEEAGPRLATACRRLVRELAREAGGGPARVGIRTLEAVLDRLRGTWSGPAVRVFDPAGAREHSYEVPLESFRPTRSRPVRTDGDGEPPAPAHASRPAPPSRGLGTGPAEEDPPRSAYARLDAPEAVVAETEIEVVVGLAPEPSPGVTGGPMVRPPSSVGAYTLTVQLVADGFRLRDGETWRRELPVTAAAPYPTAAFHLTPEPQQEEVRARILQALFTVDGQTMGVAVRPVAVVRSRELLAGAPRPAPAPGVDMAVPTEGAAPDLEVRILLDPEREGRLLWTFGSRHAGIDLPDEALATEIGGDPKGFARQIVDKVNLREGKQGVYNLLAGLGITIADQVPAVFWDLLRAAAEQAGGPPDLLILSQEPYVPWELAKLDAPLIDPQAPPFLAAQANVGRWVLPSQEAAGSSRRQRPRQPPPVEVPVAAMAVVSGVYSRPGWSRLKEAEAEAEQLHTLYGAAKVDAESLPVYDCLSGTPSADLLHFAVHGQYDQSGLQDGLMLVDGETLDPFQVQGTELGRAPFVFLNACQVGSGSRILGDYAGMAAAFLVAGAAGVVAPLWSVKDTIAKEIALAFYEKAKTGACPAMALREARKAFRATAAPQSATWLAYQFFGHPSLKLRFSIP